MKILISGSSGLIGRELSKRLVEDGHQVIPLIRPESRMQEGTVLWDPDAGLLDLSGAGDINAVVHLAGENIAARRWSPAQKKRIRVSRVKGTQLLARAVASLPDPPEVLVCGSAIGFYGDRGDEILDENSDPGSGFLAGVCREWEDACEPAVDGSIRTVHLRTGVVLAREGGALDRMLTLFRLGLGGRLGNGHQYMSWITLGDEIAAICHILNSSNLSGPVNLVSPHPVTNAEFTRTLAKTVRRPAILPAPAFALRLALGEMADALLLSSTRVVPKKLCDTGFEFRNKELGEALAALV